MLGASDGWRGGGRSNLGQRSGSSPKDTYAETQLRSQRLGDFRAQERRQLSQASERARKENFQALAAFRTGHRQRAEEMTDGHAFHLNQVTEWDVAEDQRHRWLPALRARTQSESSFRVAVSGIFKDRVAVPDEFADLRAEKRDLLEQARQQRLQLLLERSRVKHERAAERRPNNGDTIRLRLEKKEADKLEKTEFHRKLTGWDGKKLSRRTKSVTTLWNEYKKAQTFSGVAATSSQATVSDDPVRCSSTSWPPEAQPAVDEERRALNAVARKAEEELANRLQEEMLAEQMAEMAALGEQDPSCGEFVPAATINPLRATA